MSMIEVIIIIAGTAAKMIIGWMRLGTPRRVELFFSAEDAGWIATCDLPGISAFGDTPEQALYELRRVYQLAIEVYQAEGWPI